MGGTGAEPVYGIGAVARRLGSTPASIRAWEGRYGIVIPSRSPGGQRQYSQDQVDQLRYVQDLVASGLQASDAHRLLALRLRKGTTPAPADPSEWGDTASILLVERDVYAADFVEGLLRAEGHKVTVALNRPDAIGVYEQERPDLVFVELVTSGGSGLELCRALSAAGARAVALCALDLGAAAIEAGAKAFLRKPLDRRSVVSTVEALLGAGRAPASEVPSF